jgi:hypothetical protein
VKVFIGSSLFCPYSGLEAYGNFIRIQSGFSVDYLGYAGQREIAETSCQLRHTRFFEEVSVLFRLDYLSCVLTVVSTVLLGKRCWEGWILAAINSAIVCVIGFRTAQFGFIPANVFCIALYAVNLRSWRKPETH